MKITDEIIQAFRDYYDEFSDEEKWPRKALYRALNEADSETGSSRWGVFNIDDPQNFKQRGLFYYAAHWLASFYGKTAKDLKKIDPAARLNTAAKSVGDESIAYRVTAMETTGNDWLSTTTYGVQFWRLKRRMMGAMAV